MRSIPIKPLSVNKAWQGRRFKTNDYKKYERDVIRLLTGMKIPEGKLFLYLECGQSNKQADFDNPVKPFVDCLQKRYGFNDRMIYDSRIRKLDVKKGQEYIKFDLVALSEESS